METESYWHRHGSKIEVGVRVVSPSKDIRAFNADVTAIPLCVEKIRQTRKKRSIVIFWNSQATFKVLHCTGQIKARVGLRTCCEPTQ